jgi:protein SCO1
MKSIALQPILARATTLFALFFLLLAAACSDKAPQFKSIDLTGADYAKNFSLPDVNGQTKTIADFQGKVVVVFFGFTQCPDVCPTTMAEVAEAKKLLGKDGERVTAIFVTVDPERDTPQVLKAYMQSFDPSFTALRGSEAQVAALAKDFKVYFKKVDGKTPTSYTFDHTAASFVYDPQGKLRLYTRYGLGPQALADDLRILLR